MPLSIYIHIPFCSTKCTYCAFNTYVSLENLIPNFVDALKCELQIVGESKPAQKVGTIFFGGGTPSLLTPEQFAQIMNATRTYFDVAPDAEVSIEANPHDLDEGYLSALRALGINRLSIGMQSAVESELKLFHRRHDAQRTVTAMSSARAAGFDNVNLDLIYGVPNQTLSDWELSLRSALELSPEHISLYALGLEDGTLLKSWVEQGQVPTPDDDLAADMYELATEMLGQAGYEQYEISNWAKSGRECRHNLQYWYNLPYVGIGPGAHGFAGGVRYSVVRLPQKYIDSLQNSTGDVIFPYSPALDESVVVDRDNEISETLIMGLRLLKEGIRRDDFRERFNADLLDIHGAVIQKYANFGLLDVTSEHVKLTQRGRLLSNMIFRELV